MCLGIPCQVVAPPAGGAVVARDGERQVEVSLLTLPGPVVAGDWLLVHCGLALARLTEDEALDALAIRTYEEKT